MPDNRNASFSDMIRSIAVVGVLMLGVAAVGYWFQVKPDSNEKNIDYRSAAVSAQKQATFDLLIPETLPDGWKATSVRFDKGAGSAKGQWHLGVVTKDKEYIGLEQGGASPRAAVDEFAPETKTAGSVDVGGHEWTLRESGRKETTLVREENGITLLVTGTAKRSQIEKYVEGLVSAEDT